MEPEIPDSIREPQLQIPEPISIDISLLWRSQLLFPDLNYTSIPPVQIEYSGTTSESTSTTPPQLPVTPPLSSTSSIFKIPPWNPPPPPPQIIAAPLAKEIKLRTLTPYDGDRDQLDDFLMEIEIYIIINDEIYDAPKKKIIFMLSYMNQ